MRTTKQIIALALAAISLAASALVQVVDQPAHVLKKGTLTLGTFATHDACVLGAAGYKLTGTFECLPTTQIITTLVAGPQPASETQRLACPAGSIAGSTWSQTRSYVSAPSPTFWKPGPWAPTSPPPGACKPLPQPPDETRTQACPAPASPSQTWTQSRKYVAAPPPAMWIAGPWLPTQPPATSCVAPPPPQPQGEFQMLSCPAGSVPGSQWRQDRDYIPAPPPVYWTPGPWTPDVAPSTACPTDSGPPHMHAGWPVDPASVDLSVHLGSSDILVTPPLSFDCKTAADAVPGCTWPGPSGDGTGAFRNVAFPATMGWFDPIVHPGEPDSSHLHQFFGNTGVSKDSTGGSLIASCNSTFRGGAVSCSAVWTPVMVDTKDNTVRRARNVIVYYKKGAWTDPKQIQPIPVGLKMVIGNPSAMSFVHWGIAGFSCDGFAFASDNDLPFTGGSHVIPTLAQCGVGHGVWMTAVAPNCWDGVNLYKPDGSHMAYPPSPWPPEILSNGCMPDHPILLPQVAVLAITDVGPNDDPGRWVLTSDHPMDAALAGTDQVMTLPDGQIVKRGVSMHVDYFAAIPPAIQQFFIDGCDRASLDCAAHMLGNGHTMDAFGGN